MSLRDTLLACRAQAHKKQMTIGFDGFIDTITRPVLQAATADAPEQYFDTMADFGRYLAGQSGKSCSLELAVTARQLGGNLPYVSRAAGRLGLDVTCIGMLGRDGIDPVFAGMPCRLYSFAPAADSTALEFHDGKIFLANRQTLPGDPWSHVEAAAPDAAGLFARADLLALVNWSELEFSHALWQGVWDKALAPAPREKHKYAYFDLCDMTRRTNEQLRAVLRLIGRFSERRTTVLSLNQNEALLAGQRALAGLSDLEQIAHALRQTYGIDEIIIHTVRETLLVTGLGVERQASIYVERPKISTGAGDNFNGASCFAAVMGLSPAERVAFANRFAHFYITEGYSPTLDELIERL